MSVTPAAKQGLGSANIGVIKQRRPRREWKAEGNIVKSKLPSSRTGYGCPEFRFNRGHQSRQLAKQQEAAGVMAGAYFCQLSGVTTLRLLTVSINAVAFG